MNHVAGLDREGRKRRLVVYSMDTRIFSLGIDFSIPLCNTSVCSFHVHPSGEGSTSLATL